MIDVGGINFFKILAEIRNPGNYEIAIDPDLMPKPPEIRLEEEPEENQPGQEDPRTEKGIKEEETEKLDYYFAFTDLKLADGTYTGEAYGYSPRLRVEVKIANNMVVGIKILSHMEIGVDYYAKAMQTIPKEILEKQALEVDVVSGASLTSFGIINAVREAVLEAGGL